MQGRILAIGDLHGCPEKLRALLERIAPDPGSDQLIFLGDYLDRGPDPRAVVETLIALRDAAPQTICLMGNHEAMFLDFYLRGNNEARFMQNGGWCTLAAYGMTLAEARVGRGFPGRHLRFLESLPLYHETADFLFVHAGIRPGLPMASQDPEELLWIRGAFIDNPSPCAKTVVFGHTVLGEPLLREDRIGIDTGAVYGGPLTCVELPARRIHQR